MAHVCPECGSWCYCHGDIDDCEIPGEEMYCLHCDGEDEEGEYYADHEINQLMSFPRPHQGEDKVE